MSQRRHSPEEYEPEPGGLFAESRQKPMPFSLVNAWKAERDFDSKEGKTFSEAPPPVPLGATFDPELDRERLGAQFKRVEASMADGIWATLREISIDTGDPEASVSARLRDMRRVGWEVERRRRSPGTHEYRASRKP